ncbi:MAG: HipA-like protein, partial [Thermoleophilia bacterium]|nr:HipA-like protein [Thermoleophilia bacterium]
ALPLGHAMPVRTEAYPHRTCLAVFGGVLPEEDVRRAVAAMLGISTTNDYRLLHELGGDCAGAIEFFPEEAPRDRCGTARVIDMSELDRILIELPKRPLPTDQNNGHARMSLAGAQGKLPVTVTEQLLSLPGASGVPSTHILKPEPERFPGLVDNEGFCMSLARSLELRVAHVRTAKTLSGLPYLFVRRYDRDLFSEPVKRLHQEDMCQALERLPSEKYQAEGGPSFLELTQLLRRASAVPAHDVAHLWDALVFNVLIGNCDAHGKNYSLLYDAGAPTLAPLYDLVATSLYPELTTRLAMTIGDAVVLDEVDLGSWEKCARQCGYNPNYAIQRVKELASRTATAASIMLTNDQHNTPTGRLIAERIEVRANAWLA